MSAAVGMLMSRKSSGHTGESPNEELVGFLYLFIFGVIVISPIAGVSFHSWVHSTQAEIQFSVIHLDGEIELVQGQADVKVGETIRITLLVKGDKDRRVWVTAHSYGDERLGLVTHKLVRLPVSTMTFDLKYEKPGENVIEVEVSNDQIQNTERRHLVAFCCLAITIR